MKKRILCIALTLALLIGLIPLSAVSANAASELVASEAMIEVLKKFEGFSKYPYWDYSQWTVGYGTRVPDGKLDEYKKNGIPEEEAEALLADFLKTMGTSINEFADKFGLSLNQGQFDALLSLTFNCGTGWLYKPSTLRTAVVEGWTGDDFIFAFGQWSNSGNETLPGLVRRRLAEANMYLNAVYEVSPPADYGYVQFNPNGGETVIKVQGYDINTAPAIRAVPTYADFVFDGWYTDPTGGEKVTNLDAGVKGYTLYAHWRAGEGSGAPQDPPQEITGTPVNYEKQIATGVLNSFEQPVKGALVVDAYQNGEVVKIVAEYTDASGIKWGEVANEGGWINLAYTQDFDGDAGEEGPGVKITVTGTNVNLRRGPGTTYSVVGQANKGDTLEITSTANGSGYIWGKSSKGWIALKYTDYDAVVKGEEPKEDPKPEEEPGKEEQPKPETPAEKAVATGKVKVQSGKLNVRKGPSTGYEVVDYLSNGDPVEIFEIKQVGATKWGRISKGWISLTYVTLDNTQPPEQDKEEEKDEPKPEEGGSSGITGKVVVSSGKLNIRSGAGTNYSVVGWLSAGDKVTITEQKTVNGTPWGKIDKGWVCMNYISLDKNEGNNGGNTGSDSGSGNGSNVVKGVVSAGGSMLRIRTGPGSSYAIAGYLEDGAAVEILEQKTVGATVWGRISKGWISMTYVKVDGNAPAPEEDKKDDGSFTGIVIADVLNVRSGAGTNNRIVGRLYEGQTVTILETKDVNGTKWGRINTGWICMDYIR